MSKARHAAIGGVFSALSILLMFMSLFMPLTHLWVAFGGFMILLIVIEAGRKTAFCSYIAVVFLCFILIPNIVRVAEFMLFIGYYPIIKMQLDNIGRIWLRRLVKFVLFIVCAVINLIVFIHVLGIAVAFEQIQQVGMYIALPLGQMLILYIGYDYLLKHFHLYYIAKLRSKISPPHK